MKTFDLPILSQADFYKTGHHAQLPPGTTALYENFTPRSSRLPGVNKAVFFGLQYFIKRYLIQSFAETFFRLPKEKAVGAYKRRLERALGPGVSVAHWEALHDLGFLPLKIKALPEGSVVPMQVPMFTVRATKAEFAWLAGYIETMISATVWGPSTSATTAHEYRKTFDAYARKTGGSADFVPWQGHDFSMRGMFGLEAAAMSGAGHLLSFTGTDTIAAIDFLERYYNADADADLIGGSVPATEHAVMCAGGSSPEEEIATYKRLLTEVYPTGVVSIVSDTWDFWRVVTEYLPALKDVILGRNGKLVIRPDSGDPVKILTGDTGFVPPRPPTGYLAGVAQRRGLVASLWDLFGGTTNAAGYRELDPHVGAIYGDSITRERQEQILDRLAGQQFASTNVVLGIGSYTYQYVTRDTLGFAIKATYAEVNGEPREIFKAPKTDSGKNSARGLIRVDKVDGELVARYPVTLQEEAGGELRTVFVDGMLVNEETLHGIRTRLAEARERELKA